MPETGSSTNARFANALPVATLPWQNGTKNQRCGRHPDMDRARALEQKMANLLHSIRLDYVSCVLTVLGAILLGRKLWQGWVVAAVNSAVVCVIGVRTAQFGFIPANLFCIALYTFNLRTWRFRSKSS